MEKRLAVLIENKTAILIVVILIVGIIAVYITFFYHPKCKDVKCWDERLKTCSKAVYINEPIDVTWLYTIDGKKSGNCEVKVKMLEIKRGLKQAEILKGKEMTCLLPLGFKVAPESNPNLCTGPLKEAMQALIIQKLHEYILENTGQIEEELTSVKGITSGSSSSASNSTASNSVNNSS